MKRPILQLLVDPVNSRPVNTINILTLTNTSAPESRFRLSVVTMILFPLNRRSQNYPIVVSTETYCDLFSSRFFSPSSFATVCSEEHTFLFFFENPNFLKFERSIFLSSPFIFPFLHLLLRQLRNMGVSFSRAPD